MNSPQPVSGSAAPRRNWTRRLVNVLVALVVIAVAGATFVFSYAGVHAIALLGGVSAQLARYYPGLFDAVLVIACVAAVVLRDGRWWARLWAWLVIIIVLGAIGTTDVLHAMDYTLRHRVTEGIVAAAPVVAVLLAFSLLLTLLRQSRPHAPSAPVATPLDVPALPAAISASPIALPAAPAVSAADAETAPLERQAEPLATGPTPTIAVPVAPPTEPVPVPPAERVPVPSAGPVPMPPAESMPAPPASPLPDMAPASQESVHTEEAQDAIPAEEDATPGEGAAPEADAAREDAAPREAHPATEPIEVISATAPALDSPAVPEEPAPPPEEPAPPTVVVPAVTVSAVPERSQGIRYAGNGARNTPLSQDYWEADDTEQFAGLVYRARDDDDVPDGPSARPSQPELDDDAPPFATAPFAAMPRLNRVRSMPTPPVDEDEEEDE